MNQKINYYKKIFDKFGIRKDQIVATGSDNKENQSLSGLCSEEAPTSLDSETSDLNGVAARRNHKLIRKDHVEEIKSFLSSFVNCNTQLKCSIPKL